MKTEKGMRERIKHAATRAEVETLLNAVLSGTYPARYRQRCEAAALRRLNGLTEGGGK